MKPATILIILLISIVLISGCTTEGSTGGTVVDQSDDSIEVEQKENESIIKPEETPEAEYMFTDVGETQIKDVPEISSIVHKQNSTLKITLVKFGKKNFWQ